MKTKHLFSLMLASVVGVTISLAEPAPQMPIAATEQIGGTVSMYLLNPRGEVDGLLLTDGTR